MGRKWFAFELAVTYDSRLHDKDVTDTLAKEIACADELLGSSVDADGIRMLRFGFFNKKTANAAFDKFYENKLYESQEIFTVESLRSRKGR